MQHTKFIADRPTQHKPFKIRRHSKINSRNLRHKVNERCYRQDINILL